MTTDLEARVKALEDLVQSIQRCFLAPPTTPTPKPTAQPKPTTTPTATETGFHGSTTKEGDVCPECGGKKKPGYIKCYNCYMEQH